MIITLKNANFSSSNIGTLYTWRITRQIGAGAIFTGANSVLKGEPYVATIVLDDSYQIASSGIILTMGGVDISNYSVSEDGLTITISIPSVTGNVYIKVPTTNVAIDINNIVFDFDFTMKTLSDYLNDNIFTVPTNSTIDNITYDPLYGANLNNNLPNGLSLVNPIDASRSWVLEMVVTMPTPTVVAGNRRALLTGIEDISPFVVMNSNNTSTPELAFQISAGAHTWVGSKKLAFEREVFYKLVHDAASGKTTVFMDGTELGTSSADFTGKQFGTILGVIPGKSTAYIWQDVEAGKKTYLHSFKFYYK